jgi:hypothetical protein
VVTPPGSAAVDHVRTLAATPLQITELRLAAERSSLQARRSVISSSIALIRWAFRSLGGRGPGREDVHLEARLRLERTGTSG